METRGDQEWAESMSTDTSDAAARSLDERQASDDEDVPEDDGRHIEG
jgi:hypothetical protein